MTVAADSLHPAVAAHLMRYGVVFDVMPCDPELADTAAFCEHYKFAANQTCNAIIAASKTDPIKYACCVVLSDSKLDVNKKVCQLLDVKRCSFATGEQTLQLTGMQIGGVTPFGLPEMPIYFDSRIMENEKIVLGGGNRTSKVLMNPAELHKLPNVQVVEGLGVLKQ
jgi:prolyl-tRNA editing enzyme YbaK/EbsC (Cys-tRNA(Pro) deacylase)